MNHLIFLTPYISHTVWGGTRLKEAFGVTADGDDIGECWGISAHPAGESVVRDGVYKGLRLSELWYGNRDLFARRGTRFRRATDPFPLLIKLIDAQDDLSIQVHPDDTYARVHENGALGKTECWYILKAPDNGTLVIGHKAKNKKELCRRIEEGAFQELINEVAVRDGDVIPIMPGTMHAIKAGTLLLEVQENSDVTYRVYDYDRLWNGAKRTLHLEKAKDVITVPQNAADGIVHAADAKGEDQKTFLADCGYFTMERYNVEKEMRFKNLSEVFAACVVTEGEGNILSGGIEEGARQKTVKVKAGDFFLVPVECGTLRMRGRMEVVSVQPG